MNAGIFGFMMGMLGYSMQRRTREVEKTVNTQAIKDEIKRDLKEEKDRSRHMETYIKACIATGQNPADGIIWSWEIPRSHGKLTGKFL